MDNVKKSVFADQQKPFWTRGVKALILADLLSCILFAAHMLMRSFGLMLYLGVWLNAVLCTGIILMTGLVFFFLLRAKGRIPPSLFCAVGGITGAVICILVSALMLYSAPRTVRTFTSEDGARTVTVLRSGFKDAQYEAHEELNGAMYRVRKGQVRVTTGSPAEDIAVEWLSETEAKVTLTGADGEVFELTVLF